MSQETWLFKKKCHHVEIHCIKGQFLSYEGSASRCFKQKSRLQQAVFKQSANACISPCYSKAALDTPEDFSETAVN